jgi:hypothetical protein
MPVIIISEKNSLAIVATLDNVVRKRGNRDAR